MTVRVTDVAGASYDETFTIAVGDVNEGPVALDDSAATAENASISVDVLANDTDPDAGDGQVLSSVTLVSGLGTASIVGGAVSFDPGSDYDDLAVGESAVVAIDYVVTDSGGLTDTGRLTLTVTGTNDGPVVSSSLADQSATEDASFSYQIPAGSFDDLDTSDTLTYTATLADGSALPGWLSFDASTRTFSGTPENGDVGSLDVRVTATDPHGSSVDDVFTLTTANSNDAPHDLSLDNAAIDENASNGTVVGTATGSDVDVGDSLAYSLVDDAGGRFAIDASTGAITVADGSLLDHEAAASHDVTVRVTDVAGASYDETFTIAVGDVNEGPVALDDSAATAENASISVDVLANDTDPDAGDGQVLSSVTLVSGLGTASIVGGAVSFDPGSDYDDLAVGESAVVAIDYVVTDSGGLTDTGRLTLTVTGTNDGPVVSSSLADQSATEDASLSYQIPAGSFDDLDTSDTLTYTATLADGSALPGWLSFDASTRTFSGTPENGDVGSLDVRVTATDPHGSSVDDVFTLTTANSNDAPHDLSLDNAAIDENASNGTVVGTATGSDVDVGDSLAYSLVDDAGGRFAIDASTGAITVADGSLLDHEAAASHDVTVRVTDVAGASYDETFTIAVGDVNEGPVALDDSAATAENASISVDVLANDTDPDAGDGQVLSSVTLVSGLGTASIVGGAVSFDPGSDYDDLAVGESAVVAIDYVVTDSGGLTDTGRLTLTVTGTNDGPVVASSLADQSATEDASLSYQIPAGSFDDLDTSDTLTYTATLADGSALPGWLSFDASTRTFSGTPENGDVGSLDVRVTATDPHGSSVDDVFTLTTANSNDAPHDLSLDNAAIDENASNGTVVGTATGSDVDVGDSLAYSLVDDAGGRFAIDASTGAITVADGSLLDHEAAASHDVTVRVTDVAGASYDETFTIAVGDVNEGPVALDDSAATAENASISVDVLANDTDPDAGDGQVLSSVTLVSGLGTASIVGGAVSFDPGSDYDDLAVGESAVVAIDYVVTDSGGLTDTGRLTLTVTGTNDGPVVSSSLADQSATEDASLSYQIPAGSFDDLDTSDTLTYTATLADGSALPGWLSFDASTRTFSGTPENGDVGSLDVRVTATDPHGSSVDDVFTLTTANSNDAPHDLSLDNAAIDENASNGTVVGTATGSDVDVGDSLAYSLVDDAGGRFAIDASTGAITVADGSLLDHEAAASHDVTVRVTDVAGASYDETFSINVGDVNEGPVALDDSAATAENASISVDVLANDTDPDAGDGQVLSSVTLVSGLGTASIVGGAVSFDPGSDYDDLAVGESAVVAIDYVVTDSGGLTDTGRLTLTVTGTNDGPVVSSSLADQSATEDASLSYQIPAGSFDDLDTSDTLTYTATLADGSALPGWLSFDASTRTFSGTPENGDVGSLDVRVTATDPHGSSVDDVFTLTTANSNDAPHDLSLDNAAIDENASNGTVVGTATGSDVDVGDSLAYSLVDDAGGRFAIDASTGAITVADGSLLDHEAAASHDVTVRVTDVAGASYDETFTIAVGDVNEGPVALDDSAATAENASISVDVLANDTDPDAGDGQVLSSVTLVSGLGTASIVGGAVSFDPGSDYDDLAVGESAVVAIDYVVTDSGGLTDTGRLTLTVTGTNDGPVVSSSLADQSATEDASLSYQIPAGSFDDLDTSDTLTYTATLADGSALPGWLSFDASTRTFSGTPENGDVGSLDVRVTATDPHGSSVDDVFTLTTANSNDAPHDLSLDNAAIDENASNGTVVGTATGSDVDVGDSLAYSLADDAGGRFAIDASTGAITVADGSLLDHEAAASHDVTVRVTDVAGASYDETFTIAVGDVNEGPVALDDSAATAENASISVDVLANDTDPDAGDGQVLSSVTLVSGSGTASIVGGAVSFDPGSDYDDLAVGESAVVAIDYVVTDSGGLTDTGRLTLTVTGTNDGPVVSSSLADQSATEDASLSYQIPAGSFDDLDTSDTLTYTATLADGSALPGWLSFDASTRTFSGTPENGDVGSLDVRVTATDPHGSSVDDVFTLTTANSNDAPHDLSLDNAAIDENASNGTVVGTATGSDVDVGDSLAYSLVDDAGGRFAIDASTGAITVADGSLLDHEAAASHDVTVRVTDVAGASYDETFTIAVGDVNEGPTDLQSVQATSTGEMAVNTYTSSSQYEPAVAALGDGGYVVVWRSYGQDGDNSGIFGQRYDADGNSVGSEFQVNTTTASAQLQPNVIGTADGGFVVSWSGIGGDGGYDLFAQRFASDGTSSGGEVLVNTTTADNQFEPALTALNDGGYVIVWHGTSDGSSYGIHFQRYDAAGVAQSGETLVNSHTSSFQANASIDTLDDGSFVVTWQSYNQDGSSQGVYGQRFASDGTALGGEFQVNSTTAGAQYYADVSAINGGGFVAVWYDSNNADVHGQIFDGDGNSVGSEFVINSTTTDTQDEVQVSRLATGGFVVTWTSAGQDGDGDGVYGQAFDASGNKVDGEFLVADTTAGDQNTSALATLDDGRVVVAWQSPDSSGSGISAKVLGFGATAAEDASNGTVVDKITASDPDAGETFTYSLTDDADGRFAIDGSTGEITVAQDERFALDSANNPFAGIDVGSDARPDFVDIDNDGDLDAFVADSAGEIHYYENTGSATAPSFTDQGISQLGFQDLGGEAEMSFADIDGDGDMDAFVGNSTGTFDYYENTGTASAASFTYVGANQFGLGDTGDDTTSVFVDMDNDGDLDALVSGYNDGITYYENTGTATSANFVDQGNAFGFHKPDYDTAITTYDVDGDGDQDVAIGMDDGRTAFYRNDGTAASASFAYWGTDLFGLSDVGGDSSPVFIDLNGDGELDALIGDAAGNIDFFAGQATLDYETATSHDITVRVTDSGGLTYDETVTINVADSTEAPVLTDITGTSIAENSSNGTEIGRVGFDLQVGGTATYSLLDDAGGRFAIDTGTGAVTVADGSLLDYESAASHDIAVQVTDGLGNTVTETITLTVGNVNDTPHDITMTSGGSVVEDAAVGTVVANFAGSDQDAGETLAFTITDNADGRFYIDQSGNLRVSDIMFERDDAANPFAGIDFGRETRPDFVDIDNDGDLDAFFGDYFGAITFYENTGSATAASFTDRGVNQLGFQDLGWCSEMSFVDIDNDGDLDAFVGDFYGAIDYYENTGSASSPIFTHVGDNQFGLGDIGLRSSSAFVDIDNDGDLDALVTGDDTSLRFFENTGTASSANFVDQGNSFGFATHLGASTVTVYDYDADGDQDVIIGTEAGSLEVYENVGGVGAPSFTYVGSNAIGFDGVQQAAAPVFADLDGDGQSELFVGNNNGGVEYFSATGGGTFLDFETATSHDVTVRVIDSGGATYDETFTINVTDGNDAPSDLSLTYEPPSLFAGFALNEGSGATANSLDGSTTMSLVNGTGWTIGPHGGSAIDFPGVEGANNTLDAGARIDGITTGGAMTFSAYVRFDTTGEWERIFDFGDGPWQLNINAGREWTTDSMRIEIVDAGGTGHRLVAPGAIVDGEWAHWTFTIESDGVTTIYKNGVALVSADLGDPPPVAVRSNNYLGVSNWEGDQALDGAIADFTIHNAALSADEVATLYQHSQVGLDSSQIVVGENAANGTVVAAASGTDADSGDVLSYALADDAGGRFAIDSSTGEITVVDGSRLDYETATSHDVTVRVTDAAGLSYDETFTVNVGDVEGQTIVGTTGNDTLTGTAEVDTLDGANGGSDVLDGGGDSDTYYAYGDGQADTYADTGSTGTDTIILKSGTGTLFELTDQFDAANTGIEVIDGSAVSGETIRAQASGSQLNWDFSGITLTGVDQIEGRDANDSITGSSGDDTIVGGGGDDLIYGGTGSDTAVFSGNRANYTVTESGGTYTVVDNVGSDGTDTVTGIETFRFADGDVGSADVLSNSPTDLQYSTDPGTKTTVVSEDFESGATGWSNTTTTTGGAGLDGNYLGTFGDTGGAQTIYKTFTLSGNQDSVTVNFDFYEFDTWNGEDFKIWVDDALISTDVYYTQEYLGNADVSTYGTSTSDTTADLGNGGMYSDQTHSYSFTVDSSATSIKIGFGASLDEDISTEAWGIDNFEIIENQGLLTLPDEETSYDTVATGEIVDLGGGTASIDRWSLSHEGGGLTIDLLADGYSGGSMDSVVYLYRDDGGSYSLVGTNDDGAAGGDGSTSLYDSFLSLSNLAAGSYIIAVGAYGTTSLRRSRVAPMTVLLHQVGAPIS